jgi:hypothetical protein
MTLEADFLTTASPDRALHWQRSRFLRLLGQDGPERNRAEERLSSDRVAPVTLVRVLISTAMLARQAPVEGEP